MTGVLVAAGKPELILRAMQSAKTGKLSPTSLYVHINALSGLPAILRVYEGCARLLAGRPETTTIVRLHHNEPAVSYMSYPDFDINPHPSLASALDVNLRNQKIRWTDHSKSPDPPILHRREDFVSTQHPQRLAWMKRTAQEAKAGLFDDPLSIKTLSGWRAAQEKSASPSATYSSRPA